MFKIILWNKGNSNISIKIDEIREIASRKKPEVIIINEFNYNKDDAVSSTIIENYNLELDTLEKDIETHILLPL